MNRVSILAALSVFLLVVPAAAQVELTVDERVRFDNSLEAGDYSDCETVVETLRLRTGGEEAASLAYQRFKSLLLSRSASLPGRIGARRFLISFRKVPGCYVDGLPTPCYVDSLPTS